MRPSPIPPGARNGAALMAGNGLRADAELTLRAFEREGAWLISKNDETLGEYDTTGDTVHAACLAARSAEDNGHTARVLCPTAP